MESFFTLFKRMDSVSEWRHAIVSFIKSQSSSASQSPWPGTNPQNSDLPLSHTEEMGGIITFLLRKSTFPSQNVLFSRQLLKPSMSFSLGSQPFSILKLKLIFSSFLSCPVPLFLHLSRSSAFLFGYSFFKALMPVTWLFVRHVGIYKWHNLLYTTVRLLSLTVPEIYSLTALEVFF